jgi:hypothetical protein
MDSALEIEMEVERRDEMEFEKGEDVILTPTEVMRELRLIKKKDRVQPRLRIPRRRRK